MPITDRIGDTPGRSILKPKMYVLDTSVLVHDPDAVRKFRDHMVGIPIFVVMELDDLKVGPRPEVASTARAASRRLMKSLELEKGKENPRVRILGGSLPSLESATSHRKMDLLILQEAKKYKAAYDVTLVTKDVNLRILSESEGVNAEDYKSDRVDESEIPSGIRQVAIESVGLLDPFYGPDKTGVVPGVDPRTLIENEFLAFTSEDSKQPAYFRWKSGRLLPLSQTSSKTRITPRNVEQRMALDLLLDPEIQLVTLLGIAGTGKSYLALAAGLSLLESGPIDRILLSKPVVAMGRDLGYLPGAEADKLQPWMLSFYDNLDQIFSPDKSDKKRTKEKNWEQLLHSGKIDLQPIHSIRGRSVANAFMLVDEGQNLTPHEVKTLVSRAAKDTKVVICGDPSQIDDPYLDKLTNGLVHAATKTRGSPIAGTVTLTCGVRSPLAELAAKSL